MIGFRLAPLPVSLALLSGCAYYNGMWSAQRLARDAQRLETRGQEAEARTVWGRAAIKAESVLVRHANSRWADDALVLQGEALARSGSCAAAARPLTRALQNVSDDALHERAALAAAECAIRLGEVAAAERLLVPLLASTDARRRSSAAYLAGRAAFDRGDAVTAAERFARSERDEAAPAQVRAVVAAGGTDRAVALIESVAHRDRDETRWADALADLGRRAGAATAADGLDRLLARGRLPAGSRARLLLADGDRLRAAQVIDRAAARYVQVASLVPDSAEGGRARVRIVSLQASRARTTAGLDSVSWQLNRMMPGLGGAALAEARELQLQLAAARGGSADTSAIEDFRAAELARDTLAAPALAAALFLRFVDRHPASLFAPKALIAAAQLRPEAVDSISAVLRARYPVSPYSVVFRGETSPAFQIMEDSLASALGVSRPGARLRSGFAVRIASPRTGPRGPELDPPLPGLASASPNRRVAPPREQRPSDRERPAERPTERPTTRPEDRP
ncbi:MAG TPA: hypothetical protein VJ816_12870 [Gemmatimonadales bacterium]|nr:hypothetical protein [Gemmatimonadales bacterium]